ncbi:hypothetical protein AVEN_251538-1 [Araneus ventricosus]|uniref:Uncharacterized protein n=1 Tax=Araneus ventricosus TaxID=182803 RepID=A0A4Y2T989_ARAVE|nr:hypothetical protein AVEN_251538-1 [Araneus ventricosus]
MHICLFEFSKLVTSQDMNKRSKGRFFGEKLLPYTFPVGITQTAGVWTFPTTLQDFRLRITVACASEATYMLKRVQSEIQAMAQICIADDGEYFEHR